MSQPDLKAQLLAQLRQRIDKVPTSYPQWSVQQSRAFKKWVVSARKTAESGRATETQLTSLINHYDTL